jgi:magnesium-transporting ATPase (P-type)
MDFLHKIQIYYINWITFTLSHSTWWRRVEGTCINKALSNFQAVWVLFVDEWQAPQFWKFVSNSMLCTLTSIISPSLMSLSLSYIPNPSETDVLSLRLSPCCHISLSYIMSFDIEINHQKIQITCSHASHFHHCNYCHYRNVDFMLFYNVTCYINSLLPWICVSTSNLL